MAIHLYRNVPALAQVLLILILPGFAVAQTSPPAYSVNTFAGAPPTGDGGPAASAVLRWPAALALDASGNLYIADQGNASIRKVAPDGVITTLAGTGQSGFSGDGGPASQAQLSAMLTAIAVDSGGNIYVADAGNNRVRKISGDGTITTVADGSKAPGGGETYFGFSGMALAGAGDIYLTDYTFNQVYRVSPDGSFSVIAGSGNSGDGGDGGPATRATFSGLMGISLDPSGAIYVCDFDANRIRKINPDGTITAVAGTGQDGFSGDGGPASQAALSGPAYPIPDGNGGLYFTDYYNNRIRRIAADGTISTVAGADNPNQIAAGDGGPATQALLASPEGSALSPAGDLYICDFDSAVRVVTASDGAINTVVGRPHFAGDGGPALEALFSQPMAFAGDGKGNLYIGDTGNFRIRKIDSSGGLSTIAGNGTGGFSGDGGPATQASIGSVLSVVADAAGNVYFGTYARVRRISADGTMTSVAGGGSSLGDGGPATSAGFGNGVSGLALDAAGSLYISDTGNHRVRKVAPDGTISTIAGTGTNGDSGDGGPATAASLRQPYGLAFDGAGNLYVADAAANRVRRIAPDGTISAFAGTGDYGESGDGGPARSAQLSTPLAIGVDGAGNVYIVDWGWQAVRVVTRDGVIHTIAAQKPENPFGMAGDGGPATGAGYDGLGAIAFDSTGKLYLLDSNNERIRVLTPPFTLRVAKAGSGNGPVASSPAGIDCGVACSATYTSGTQVTLTATPDADSGFGGWSGACSGTESCVVTMDGDKSVTATFTGIASQPSLTVSKTGSGTGTVTSSPAGINCGAACSATFASGTTVTLSAAPASGSGFSGWSGACSGTESCVVAMDASKSVTATFTSAGPVSSSAVSLTDANGLATVSSQGVSIPVRLTDPTTGEPIQDMQVSLGLPSSQKGVAMLLLNDPLGWYPMQFVTLTAPKSSSPAKTDGAREAATPTSVQVQDGCPSSLPATITARRPSESIYVPGPPPPTPWEVKTDADLNALSNLAATLGVNMSFRDRQLYFTSAGDCATAMFNWIRPEALREGEVALLIYGVERITDMELGPFHVLYGMYEADVDKMRFPLSVCQNWAKSAFVRTVDFGNQKLYFAQWSGTPSAADVSRQEVTTRSAQGQPLPSSLCYVSGGTLGGVFPAATDSTGKGAVYLPSDNYTVDITALGYKPQQQNIVIPAPGQPVPPLAATMTPLASASDLTGTWSGTWNRPVSGLCSQTSDLTWRLTQKGADVTGTFEETITATSGLCPDPQGTKKSGKLVQGKVEGTTLTIYSEGGTRFEGKIKTATQMEVTPHSALGTSTFTLNKKSNLP